MIILCLLLLLQDVHGYPEDSSELSEKSNTPKQSRFRSDLEERTSKENERDGKDENRNFDFYTPFKPITPNKESLGIGFQKPKEISENLRSFLRKKYSDKFSVSPKDEEREQHKEFKYGFQPEMKEQDSGEKKSEKEKSIRHWRDQEDKISAQKYPVEKESPSKSKAPVVYPKLGNKSNVYSVYENSPKQRANPDERESHTVRGHHLVSDGYYYSKPDDVDENRYRHPEPVANGWGSEGKSSNEERYPGRYEGENVRPPFHGEEYSSKFKPNPSYGEQYPVKFNTNPDSEQYPSKYKSNLYGEQYPGKLNTNPHTEQNPSKLKSDPYSEQYPVKFNTNPDSEQYHSKYKSNLYGEQYPGKFNKNSHSEQNPSKLKSNPYSEQYPVKFNTNPHSEQYPSKFKSNPYGDQHPGKFNTNPHSEQYPSKFNTDSHEEQYPNKFSSNSHRGQYPNKFSTDTRGEQYPNKFSPISPSEQYPNKFSTNTHGEGYPSKFTSDVQPEFEAGYSGTHYPGKELREEYEKDMKKKEDFLQDHEKKLAELHKKHTEAYKQFMGKHLP